MMHLKTTNFVILVLAFRVCVIDGKECQRDDECDSDKACENFQCVDPCKTNGGAPCGANSECEVNNHVSKCVCQLGFTGNPYMNCTSECATNEDCDTHSSCAYGACVNPCLATASCGTNTVCSVVDHRIFCTCKKGFSGNPYETCDQTSCYSDADCDTNKACYFRKCVNPCDNSAIRCGKNAICSPLRHRPSCSCRRGHFGDPIYKCHAAQPGIGGESPESWRLNSEYNKYHAEISFKTTWDGALELCKNKGRRLASVMSQKENEQILTVIAQTRVRNSHFWTAGTDKYKEDYWVWETTGQPFNFSYWHLLQPDNLFLVGGEDCMGYKEVFSKYKWNDKKCTHNAYTICEEFNNVK